MTLITRLDARDRETGDALLQVRQKALGFGLACVREEKKMFGR